MDRVRDHFKPITSASLYCTFDIKQRCVPFTVQLDNMYSVCARNVTDLEYDNIRVYSF